MSKFNKELLKYLRIKKGYSLQKLADLCKFTKQTLWNLETKDSNISAKNLFKLSKALNVKMECFYYNDFVEPIENITKEFVKIQLSKLLRGLNEESNMRDIVKINTTEIMTYDETASFSKSDVKKAFKKIKDKKSFWERVKNVRI